MPVQTALCLGLGIIGVEPEPQSSRARLYTSLRDEDFPISWEDDVSSADEPKVGSADSHSTRSIPDQNFDLSAHRFRLQDRDRLYSQTKLLMYLPRIQHSRQQTWLS